MARRQKTKLNVRVSHAEFDIQEDRKLGLCKFSYSVYTEDSNKEGLSLRFRILSCWMDSHTGNAVKVHGIVGKKNPTHREFLGYLKKVHAIDAPNGNCLTSDGTIVRFGQRPGGGRFSTNDQETYATVQYYDSKAQAFHHLLETINRYQTIGGLNLVSLNRLPGSILVEIGYEEVPDLMGIGVPMWRGSPSVLGESGYGVSVTRRQQFLDLISNAINEPPAESSSADEPAAA